ncbi:MAG: hypothetical protein B7X57_11215 [Erythrobacter sp. 34-65-8]|nr:MAG: hypothetical protein B7X57_11215 [Erythrobacter sp. 34-65-8]
MQTINPGTGQKTMIKQPSNGFRRLSPAMLATGRVAENFTGLSDGEGGPGSILAAFKAAAPYLGLSPRTVHAVDWLFRFTQRQDWESGSRPVVWPSAFMQGEALGLSLSQVKALNRHLVELGLVVMKDSPYAAIDGADAVVIVTEWDAFRALDLPRVKQLLNAPVLVDLRNIYTAEDVRAAGFEYTSIGRA